MSKYISTALAAGILLVASVAIADIVAESFKADISTDVSLTRLTLHKPDGTQANDILLATIAVNGGNQVQVSPPSSAWQLIESTDNDSNVEVVTYYKIATGGEPSSENWDITPQTHAAGGIVRYSGVDTQNPIGAHAGATGRSNTAIAPAITPAGTNDKIVVVAGMDFGTTNSPLFQTSTAAGMMTVYDKKNTPLGPTITVQDGAQETVGPGAKSIPTGSGAPHEWAAQQIALRQTPPTAPSIMDSLPLSVREVVKVTSESVNYTVPSGGSNKMMVVIIAGPPCHEIMSATQNGQPLTLVPVTGTYNRANYCIAYRPTPQSGQFEMDFDISDHLAGVNYLLMTIQNADQTNPVDAVNVVTNSNLTSSQSTSVTTTVGNDLLLSKSFYAGNSDVTVSSYGSGESAIQPVHNFSNGTGGGLGLNAATQKNAAATPGVESMVTHWSLQGDIDELVVAIRPAQ